MKYLWNIAVSLACLATASTTPCAHQSSVRPEASYASTTGDSCPAPSATVLGETLEAEGVEHPPGDPEALVACPAHRCPTLLPTQASSRVPLARAERIASLVVFAQPARGPPRHG